MTRHTYPTRRQSRKIPSLQGNWYEARSIMTTSATSVERMGLITTSGRSSSGAVAIGALYQLLVHAARKLEILPRLALVRRGSQKVGGMIRNDERHMQLAEGVYRPTQPRERCVGSEQVLGGDTPDREHDLGLQQRDLPQQVGQARGDLVRPGIPVVRRTALEDVGNVDIAPAIETDGSQHGVKQLTGGPHERFTAAVFFRARRLADHQPVRARRTHPQHSLRARRVQRT